MHDQRPMRRDRVDEPEIRGNEDSQDEIEDGRFDTIDEELPTLIIVAFEEDEFRIFLAGTYDCFDHVGEIALSVLFE